MSPERLKKIEKIVEELQNIREIETDDFFEKLAESLETEFMKSWRKVIIEIENSEVRLNGACEIFLEELKKIKK